MKSYGRLFLAIIIALLVTVVYPVGAKSINLEGGNSVVIKGPDGVECVSTQDGQKVIAIGSIQAAIDAAQEGATIFLKHKTYYENVYIPRSVSIIGKGPDKTIVDGSQQAGSVFAIGMDKSGTPTLGLEVTLAGLTIRKGSGTYMEWGGPAGGGIYNDEGKLTVMDCIIKDNTAEWGGGIFNHAVYGSATMDLINSQIFRNTATLDGGGIFNGYGYYGGTVTLTLKNSQIFGNTADYGGGIDNYGYIGGRATLTLKNSQIFGNTADYWGGGILNDGQGVTAIAIVDLINSRIFGNTADLGGGIYNAGIDGGTATVNLQSGSIEYNTATASAPSGGGIYNAGGTIMGDTDIVHDNTPDQIYPPI